MNGADFVSSAVRKLNSYRGEPKIDGIRAVVNLNTLQAWNRHGMELTDGGTYLPQMRRLRELLPESVEFVDAELLGRYKDTNKVMFLLDIATAQTYEERRAIMEGLGLPVFNFEDIASAPPLVILPSASPSGMWNLCLPHKGAVVEGIVVKQVNSHYATQNINPTRTTTDWIKFRFSASVCKPV